MPLSENLRRLPWDMILIMLAAAVLRFALLDIKQAHFDEGVNGWFADRLSETGTFAYTPDNFHGPWHFYTIFLSQELLGRNVWALRLPAILAGLLMIPVLFLYARWFGRAAIRWAASAFAVSPAFVFYSRYSIHESWFALFIALFVWGCLALQYERSRAALWATAMGLTGMILNKETYIIHFATLALAFLVFIFWKKISPPSPPAEPVSKRLWSIGDLWISFGVSIFLIVFFYSGNFLHPSGLADLIKALGPWSHTGTSGNGHEKEAYDLLPFLNYYWIALFARYELPLLLGLLWLVRYAWQSPPAPRLLAIYSFGIFLAYSLIPYKTPWCILSIAWSLFLFFGAAITSFNSRWLRFLGAALIAISLVSSIRLNFFRYENDEEPYVYVQTYSSIKTLSDPLLKLSAADPRSLATPGAIYLESYYPIPWLLGDFYKIGYFSSPLPSPLPVADFHVIESARADELRSLLPPDFTEIRFHLRSGVEECSVFFSKKLMQSFHQYGILIPSYPPPR